MRLDSPTPIHPPIQITVEGENLYLEKNNRNKKAQVFAESQTAYFIKDNPGTVLFESNASGEIDRIVILDPEWQMKVAKKLP